jgi:hypothetical protein
VGGPEPVVSIVIGDWFSLQPRIRKGPATGCRGLLQRPKQLNAVAYL